MANEIADDFAHDRLCAAERVDTFVAGRRRFRILEMADDNVAEVTAHLFAVLWTVEELPD